MLKKELSSCLAGAYAERALNAFSLNEPFSRGQNPFDRFIQQLCDRSRPLAQLLIQSNDVPTICSFCLSLSPSPSLSNYLSPHPTLATSVFGFRSHADVTKADWNNPLTQYYISISRGNKRICFRRLLGTSVQFNTIQYHSSAINPSFVNLIILFDTVSHQCRFYGDFCNHSYVGHVYRTKYYSSSLGTRDPISDFLLTCGT